MDGGGGLNRKAARTRGRQAAGRRPAGTGVALLRSGRRAATKPWVAGGQRAAVPGEGTGLVRARQKALGQCNVPGGMLPGGAAEQGSSAAAALRQRGLEGAGARGMCSAPCSAPLQLLRGTRAGARAQAGGMHLHVMRQQLRAAACWMQSRGAHRGWLPQCWAPHERRLQREHRPADAAHSSHVCGEEGLTRDSRTPVVRALAINAMLQACMGTARVLPAKQRVLGE